jgi:hypothetical protein
MLLTTNHKQWRKKAKASALVTGAVKAGILVRPDLCETCGKPPRGKGKINAHHEDYDFPLDVQWLCPKCHTRLHRAKREEALTAAAERKANRIVIADLWDYAHDISERHPSNDVEWLVRQFKNVLAKLSVEQDKRLAVEAKLRELQQDTIGTNLGGA